LSELLESVNMDLVWFLNRWSKCCWRVYVVRYRRDGKLSSPWRYVHQLVATESVKHSRLLSAVNHVCNEVYYIQCCACYFVWV